MDMCYAGQNAAKIGNDGTSMLRSSSGMQWKPARRTPHLHDLRDRVMGAAALD